ncbi:MAG: hypothetical protein PUF10_02715 [Bacteroidales bacterium]|nr:hypothetical protein [Bacteroidales bacterium]
MNYDKYKRNLELLTNGIENFADSFRASFGEYKEIDMQELEVVDGYAEFRVIVRDEENPAPLTEFPMLTVFGTAKVVGGDVEITVEQHDKEYAMMRTDEYGLLYLVHDMAAAKAV